MNIRIGFNAFWDVALISTFEMALAANGIEPEFVLLSDWHDSAIEAFRNDQIDVSIHNYHTMLYDRELPASKRVGIEWIAPLFIFQGHHIFVSRRHIKQRANTQTIIKDISDRLEDQGNPLPEGLYPSDFPEHVVVLRELLKDARIGFERGTDQEIAFRRAYDFAQLQFPSNTKINRAADGSDVGRKGMARRALSNELYHAFREDKLDLYCGGWPQLYQLRRESYPVLLGPDALRINSYNGLVTTNKFKIAKHKHIIEGVRDAWFCGISLFSKWARTLKSPDGVGTVRARAEIEAILVSVENSIRAAEGERLLEDEAEEFPITAIGRTAHRLGSSADTLSSDPQNSLELRRICDQLRSATTSVDQSTVDIPLLIRSFMSKISIKPPQLADIASISDQTVYRWLQNNARPNAEHISRLEAFVDSGRSRPALHDAIREAFVEEKRRRHRRAGEWAQLLCRYDQFDREAVERCFAEWEVSDEQSLWKRSQAEYVSSVFLSQGSTRNDHKRRPRQKAK